MCTDCNKEFNFTTIEYECPECGGLLWIKTDISEYTNEFTKKHDQIKFWDYNYALPKIEKDFIITLGEGGSICRPSKKIGEGLGIKNLFFKDETQNPTNSFKDRAATLLISHAQSWDYQKAICASNGNQGASIAAYTSLEGIECINIIPKIIDIGKKAQMIAYNSKIIETGNTVDDAIEESLKSEYIDNYYQCTPEFNPLTIEGQKTISFEIFSEIGVPDWIIIPMGSGGLLVSIWKGFIELKMSGIIDEIPKLLGVQTQACSPIINEFYKKKYQDKKRIETRALGILVKNPLYQNLAIKAIRESNGIALAIPENLMLISAENLSKSEGIFAEPASALTIAALNRLIQEDKIKIDENIVCVITGSGLKTPYVLDAISRRAKTIGPGGILSTKLKILSQISLSGEKGTYGSKIHEIIGPGKKISGTYQHLKELESKDLVYRKKEGKHILYFITENGIRVLDALDTLITLL